MISMDKLNKPYLNRYKKDYFQILLLAGLLFGTVLPSFLTIGNLLFQIASVILLAIGICFLACYLENGLRNLSRSLLLFNIILIGYCVISQIILHIISHSWSNWIYQFYFDKPMSVLLLHVVIIIFFALIRLFLPINKTQEGFVDNFVYFYRLSKKSFLIIYISVLIYGFLLLRLNSGIQSVNFKLFSSIKEYFDGSISAYESFFYLFGNVFLFTPMGFFLWIRFHKKWYGKIIAFLAPCVFSVCMEALQYFAKAGFTEIDDFILNTFGAFLGILIAILVIPLRRIITKGEEDSIISTM